MMTSSLPYVAKDGYKSGHREQYPEGTQEVYSNLTCRSAKHASVNKETYDNKTVFFGLQYFIKDYLQKSWQESFFEQPKEDVLSNYKRIMSKYLFNPDFNVSHLGDLHDLGYLPIEIKALPEGSRVNIGVPMLTIRNTKSEFFWLTNYLETILSTYLWQPITSATTAFEYKKILTSFAKKTGTPLEFVGFQAHDFSFRGLSSHVSAFVSGGAHLTSFVGTDTIPAIGFVNDYYPERTQEENDDILIGCSVQATEHSVMCAGSKDGEIETFKRLINDIYPSGIVSIVSDTWDFWKVVTEYTVTLKDDILKRDGKVVIRPDSGDPVKIVAGDPDAPKGSSEYKGAVECLWEVFGGTETETGYKMLDEHIGLIYGDSITLDRCQAILERLEEKGFASGNVVFGVGSFTYQYQTRDSFGMAVKATHVKVNGEDQAIFKDPKTDDGTKKSAKGLLRVEKEGDDYVLYDQQTRDQEALGELKTVFLNGNLETSCTFSEIRDRIAQEL